MQHLFLGMQQNVAVVCCHSVVFQQCATNVSLTDPMVCTCAIALRWSNMAMENSAISYTYCSCGIGDYGIPSYGIELYHGNFPSYDIRKKLALSSSAG